MCTSCTPNVGVVAFQREHEETLTANTPIIEVFVAGGMQGFSYLRAIYSTFDTAVCVILVAVVELA